MTVAFDLNQRIVVGAGHRRELVVAARITDNLDDTVVVAHHRNRLLTVVNRNCLHNVDDVALFVNPHHLLETLQIVVRVVLDQVLLNINVSIVWRSINTRFPRWRIVYIIRRIVIVTICVHLQLFATRWRLSSAGQRLAGSHIDGVALQSRTYLNINIELIVGRRFRLGVVVFALEAHPRQRRRELVVIVIETVELEVHIDRCRRTTVEGADPNAFALLGHL